MTSHTLYTIVIRLVQKRGCHWFKSRHVA